MLRSNTAFSLRVSAGAAFTLKVNHIALWLARLGFDGLEAAKLRLIA
jgi:hypothetical protein